MIHQILALRIPLSDDLLRKLITQVGSLKVNQYLLVVKHEELKCRFMPKESAPLYFFDAGQRNSFV